MKLSIKNSCTSSFGSFIYLFRLEMLGECYSNVQDHLHAESLAAPSDWKFNSCLWKATESFKVEELRLHGKQLEHLHPYPLCGSLSVYEIIKINYKGQTNSARNEGKSAIIYSHGLDATSSCSRNQILQSTSIGFLKSHRYIVQTSVRQFLSVMKNSQFWFLKEI